LRTVDLSTYEPSRAFRERADTAAVPAAAVIGESMAAVVLAEAFLEKFGADNMTDIRASYDSYAARLRADRDAARDAARHPERDPEVRS
jgi:chorismate synthase